MSLIDISQWKEFRIEDLLGPAKHGNWINPKSLNESENGYQIVSASTINNGVSIERYSIPNEKYIVPAKVIVWGKQSPFFTYQKDPTISGQGVYYYDVSQRTPKQALFLCGVMQSRIAGRYNYQNCLIGCKCDKATICIPINSFGDPDWAYMDSFMGKILEEEEAAAEQLAALAPEAGADGHFLDVSGWKEFRIGDLFEVCTTKSLDKLMLDIDDNYPYPYIGRTPIDNGILGFLEKQSFEPNESDTFSVVQIGEKVCFYQSRQWYATQNIFKLKPLFSINKSIGLFLSSIITKTMKTAFDKNAYTSYPTKETLSKLHLILPVNGSSEPDWAWMEHYMQQQLDKVSALSEHLEKIAQ